MTTSYAPAEHQTSDADVRAGAGTPGARAERRYDLDWLRIGAFGVLILYHIGIQYVTWDDAARHQPLQFPIPRTRDGADKFAGLAVFHLRCRSPFCDGEYPAGKFLLERSTRLFVPLAFGTMVICVPQSYVALRYRAKSRRASLTFYRDYLGFERHCIKQPAGSASSLVCGSYPLLYAARGGVPAGVGGAQQTCLLRPFFGWLARGGAWRMLFVPAIPFVLYVAVLDIYLSSSGKANQAERAGTARTLTFFLIGFMTAKNEDFWRGHRPCLAGVDRPVACSGRLVAGGVAEPVRDRSRFQVAVCGAAPETILLLVAHGPAARLCPQVRKPPRSCADLLLHSRNIPVLYPAPDDRRRRGLLVHNATRHHWQ